MCSVTRCYPSFKKMVPFASSTSYYTTFYSKPRKRYVDLQKVSEGKELIYNQLVEAADYSRDEWDDFAKKLATKEIPVHRVFVNESNVDGVILRLCAQYHLYDTGKKYFDILKQKQTPVSDVLLSRYLSICALNKKAVLENKEEIIGIYKHLKKGVMEPHVAERCIAAICSYEDYWRDSLELLETVEKFTTPTPTTYCFIIEACFAFGEPEKGWTLLRALGDRAANGDFKPRPGVYISYLESLQKLNPTAKLQQIEKLFYYLDEFSISIPSIAVVESLRETMASMSDEKYEWSVTETQVPRIGVCGACRRELEPVKLTTSEFEELRKAFIKKAVVGSNVFLKSTPEEVDRFKNFIAKTVPYDIVVDGLNVAYSRKSKHPMQLSQNLKMVVEFFVNRKMKVLVLGRQHMKHWPSQYMDYVFKNSRVFLAQNLSEDDPLLLLAALKGGESTCVISRDLMRSHYFVLQDPRMKRLFRNWLVSHQYGILQFNTYGVPTIVTPVPYRPTAQKLSLVEPELCWHLPYEDHYSATPPESPSAPSHWLCVRRNFKK